MIDFPDIAISVRQPKAYLAGCLKGDAFMAAGGANSIRGYMGLRVSDRDFAEAFATAINIAYGLNVAPRKDERNYEFVRTYNGYGRFDELRDMLPSNDEQRAAWLRGLFDSEGNAHCAPKPRQGPRSWDRRVAMFSTNTETLANASAYLASLGIDCRTVEWSHGSGHKGDKPVFAVVLRAGQQNFRKFAKLIGSSIARKQTKLELCHQTYLAKEATHA